MHLVSWELRHIDVGSEPVDFPRCLVHSKRDNSGEFLVVVEVYIDAMTQSSISQSRPWSNPFS